MKSTNTQDLKIDWKNVNRDNEEKLRALKHLIRDWETQLPIHFVLLAMNIINNRTFKK
jgi:hypothetical protein